MKKMFSFSNFSHIAFFRKALTDGYPETSERQNPIFNVRLSQPRPGNTRVGHGDGERMFFSPPSGSVQQQRWQMVYKNYFANFVRTGNPNGKAFVY